MDETTSTAANWDAIIDEARRIARDFPGGIGGLAVETATLLWADDELAYLYARIEELEDERQQLIREQKD